MSHFRKNLFVFSLLSFVTLFVLTNSHDVFASEFGGASGGGGGSLIGAPDTGSYGGGGAGPSDLLHYNSYYEFEYNLAYSLDGVNYQDITNTPADYDSIVNSGSDVIYIKYSYEIYQKNDVTVWPSGSPAPAYEVDVDFPIRYLYKSGGSVKNISVSDVLSAQTYRKELVAGSINPGMYIGTKYAYEPWNCGRGWIDSECAMRKPSEGYTGPTVDWDGDGIKDLWAWPQYGMTFSYHLYFSVSRSADVLYGLQSTVTTDAVFTDNSKSVTAMAASSTHSIDGVIGKENYSRLVDGATGLSAQSFVDVPSSAESTIYSTSDKVTLKFSHQIVRGLNFKYESNDPRASKIKTSWNINRTHSGSQFDTITTNTPDVADHVDGDTPYSIPYSTLVNKYNKTVFAAKKNINTPLGFHEVQPYCEVLSHPLVESVFIEESDGAAAAVIHKSPKEIGSTSLCVHVFRPWNYSLDLSASIASGEGFIGSDTPELTAVANIKNNKNPEQGSFIQSTESPSDTAFHLFVFKLSSDSTSDAASTSDFMRGTTITGVSPNNIKAAIESRIREELDDPSASIKKSNDSKASISHNGESHLNIKFSVSPDDEAGTKYCVVAAVNFPSSSFINDGNGIGYGIKDSAAYNAGKNTWRTSPVSCKAVATKSMFQIWGGDTYASGTIDVSDRTLAGNKTGSWTDYGLIANGAIENGVLASGSFGSKGRGNLNSDDCTLSPLTIASKKKSGKCSTLGFSGISPSYSFINQITSRYANASSLPSGTSLINPTNKAFSVVNHEVHSKTGYTISSTGNFYYISDILGGTTEDFADKTQVIHIADGNLVIDRNLTYSDGPYLNLSDIPQRLIIVEKGNIFITPDVARVDAWLIAGDGVLDTCAPIFASHNSSGPTGPTDYPDDTCSTQLHINGPVSVGYADLVRTYYLTSSEVHSKEDIVKDYAERFQLPYATLVWAYTKVSGISLSHPNVVYQAKLPPRY